MILHLPGRRGGAGVGWGRMHCDRRSGRRVLRDTAGHFRVWIAGLMAATQLVAASCAGEFLQAQALPRIDEALRLAVADGRIPGGVVWVERRGERHVVAVGNRALEPVVEPLDEETIFDTASLTKVMVTAPCVMKLIESGRATLESKVGKWIPEYEGGRKANVTIRHLLTHTAGTKAGIPHSGISSVDDAVRRAALAPLQDEPGTVFRYSDINFILLGEIVEKVSGESLNEFSTRNVFMPLGMRDTMFKPRAELVHRVAPTTRDAPRGVVHDPTARAMGGVAGHAGLFSTAGDVARFCRMMLAGGVLDGVRIFEKESVRLMSEVQTDAALAVRRAAGMDIDSPFSGPRGVWFPAGSYGHTGWTGTSLWIDPYSEAFVILLTNRNHPTEAGNVLSLRFAMGTLAAEAVRGFNFAFVPGATMPGARMLEPRRERQKIVRGNVLNGIDVLVRDGFAPLRGLRVGLITNHTGVDRLQRRTADLLANAEGVTLSALFGPEHGIEGTADEKVGDRTDKGTKLRVYSLYGEHRRPQRSQLAGLDALVFDIQDIGCRFYTYSSTLGECMAAATEAGLRFFVLDRPNPIGGVRMDGPMLEDGERSFTAWHDVPVRHGLTLGEFARLVNAEREMGLSLTVIACEGWSREMWFDETGLPWVNPSPNMRSLAAAALYPGVGLIEFCNVSVGRGTDRPFEIVGAPYIDELRFAEELNAAGLAGIRFIPRRFTPGSSKFAGMECRGVECVVLDRDAMSPVEVGIELARALQRLHAREWHGEKLATLLVHPNTQRGVMELRPVDAMASGWLPARERYLERRASHLLYR
jgi:uncharacterized protein YbbC (DUF1343 family)/CubicO group peptidase (beta-lactamase class C family)